MGSLQDLAALRMLLPKHKCTQLHVQVDNCIHVVTYCVATQLPTLAASEEHLVSHSTLEQASFNLPGVSIHHKFIVCAQALG